MPYVFSHASLIRLPVSLLCFRDLYLFYKHLHCSKKKKKSQCVTAIDVGGKKSNSEIVDFFFLLSIYHVYILLIAACLQPCVPNGYSEEFET